MVKRSSQSSARTMVSESGKHAQILDEKFPNFNCICELCDCGCIARQKHSKTCKRQPFRKKGPGMIGHHKDCLMTHYQQTFKAPKQSERTLPLIPPATPRDPNPPPMSFSTTQRSEFIERGDVTRVEPIKFTDNYERSDEQVQSVTAYKESFPGHTNFPRIPPIKGRPPQQQERSLASFDARTSHKEQFRKWQTQPVVPFTDLPSFAGSILFPGKKLGELQSTSQYDFSGKTAKKPEMMKGAEGNITLDGDFDHATVHKQTYTDFGPGQRATRFQPMPKLAKSDRGSIEKQTQHMRDFPMYSSQPEPARISDPPEATIRLSMDSRLEFTTEQRNEFKGFDTFIHKKRDMIRQGSEEYKPPTEKFETQTSTKVAFQPKHLDKAERVKARRPTSQTGRVPGKFDDRTTNKKFYKDWGTKPRVRYGDIQDGRIYIPPAEKMEAESWNQSIYKPVKLDEPTKPFLPVGQPVQDSGQHDFKTVHKETYVGYQPPLCKAQAYLMQQELLRQKRIRESESEQYESRKSRDNVRTATVEVN